MVHIEGSDQSLASIILGDFLCLLGVFLLATSNVYDEWLILQGFLIKDIQSFLAPTGLVFALIESAILGELAQISKMHPEDIGP